MEEKRGPKSKYGVNMEEKRGPKSKYGVNMEENRGPISKYGMNIGERRGITEALQLLLTMPTHVMANICMLLSST